MRSFLFAVSAVTVLGGCRSDSQVGADAAPEADASAGITIYDIQTPDGPASTPGTPVEIRGVVVTAVDRFGNRTGGVYVQEPEGGAYSGVMVFDPAIGGGLAIEDILPGDIVDVTGGIVDEFSLDTDTTGRKLTEIGSPEGTQVTITRTGTGTVPAPTVVDPVLMAADDVEAEKWEGVLVTIENVAVTFPAEGVSSTDLTLAEMTVTGPFRVGSSLTSLGEAIDENTFDPSYPRDACLSLITGVGDYFFNYKILPRSADDIVEAADMSSCLYEDTLAECQNTTDDDHDGFTDCADFSCQALGACTVFTTIYDIQMGTVAKGSVVSLTDLVVTAVATDLMWVQEMGGGAYSGVAVFDGSADFSATFSIGDNVTVGGTVTEFFEVTEITSPTVIVEFGGPEPAPETVSFAALASPATAEQWEGVLVRITDAGIIDADAGFGEWIVGSAASPVRVDDIMYTPFDEPTPPGKGSCYSELIGVFHFSFDNYKIEPRRAADLGPACL